MLFIMLECFPCKCGISFYPYLGHWHRPFNAVENTGFTNNHIVFYIRIQHFKYLYNMFTNRTPWRNRTIILGPFGIRGVNCSYLWTVIHRANIGNIVLQANQNISIWNSGCTNYSRSNYPLVLAIPDVSKSFALYPVPIMGEYFTCEVID